MTEELTDEDRRARLRAIRQTLQEQEGEGYAPYLDILNLYDADPLATDPFIAPSSFISEQVGGSVGIVDHDGEFLADENLNQFLANFLPGGYVRRWGFELYRGNWDYDSEPGFADVGPMIDRTDVYELSDILEGSETVPYVPMNFEVDDVRVYVPETMRVTNENLGHPAEVDYVWLPDSGIVWTGDPPVSSTVPLSSDPTVNALWFKHPGDDPPSPSEPVEESDLFAGFGFTDEIKFLRCYYASLLTMYPLGRQDTMSGVVRYRHEGDDAIAFLGSEERSQLLTFGLEREQLRTRLAEVLAEKPRLRRDLQFTYLQTMIREELFFDQEEIPHEYAIDPLVEHLIGVDYHLKYLKSKPKGIFSPGVDLQEALRKLLPETSSNGDRRLRLLGHSAADSSNFYEIVSKNTSDFARILAHCRNDDMLLDFAERVVVHSAEHALSTWSNEYTGSGTSFELWYDENFQEGDADLARIAVYDPIQGGAGLAKEVAETYGEDDEADIAAGIRIQGRCHTGITDRAAVELLAAHDGSSLYNLFHNDREAFLDLVSDTVDDLIAETGGQSDREYNRTDLVTQVKQRINSLLETRELGAFYSYVAGLYENIASELDRTPRVADLALHLDQHGFRDPEVRGTYERFAADNGRRDLSELGERLDELSVGCISACPDCLQTDGTLCLHGNESQHTRLNRRLLYEVFEA